MVAAWNDHILDAAESVAHRIVDGGGGGTVVGPQPATAIDQHPPVCKLGSARAEQIMAEIGRARLLRAGLQIE